MADTYEEKRLHIVVLDMPLLDTRSGRDLTGTIVLQLLSYVAQTEREAIKQRQKEGIDAAKARGVQFGRKPLEKPENFEAIRAAWKNGDISGKCAAKMLGVSHTAFRNWAMEDNSKEWAANL